MLGVAQRVLQRVAAAEAAPLLIGAWSLDETAGASFADSVGDVDGTFVGTWDSLTTGSMVAGVPGTSAFKTGAAFATLPSAHPTHHLSALTISVYVQRNSGHGKQTVLAVGGVQPGDLAVEILGDDSATPGRLRAFHVGQDGMLRFFGGANGIAGTNLAVGTAYRIELSLGAQGAKIYLNGSELAAAAIPAHTNGWNNAVPKYLGSWTDGTSSLLTGALDHLRLWRGQLAAGEIAALESAQSISLPSPPTSQAVAPDTDNVPRGARYAAPGWGRAGAVVALNGRTSEPMKVLDDPRAVFTGNRANVIFEFRGIGGGPFPGGSWAKNANGDILFTSNGTAGVHSGEYRYRGAEDGFSSWMPLRIEAIARPSGQLFDVEGRSGSDAQKIQAAVNAANSAGGGVVYSSLGLARQYVIDTEIRLRRQGIHLFDLNVKRVKPTYHGGGPASANNYTGLHKRFDNLFGTQLDKGNWTGAVTATNVVNCLFDSNGFDQPICNYSGAGGSPSGTTGNTDSGGYGWPGEPPGVDGFNMQQQHSLSFANNAGGSNVPVNIRLSSFIHACGDAHSFNHNFAATMEYNEYHANQRGGLVNTERGGVFVMRRCYDDEVSQRTGRPFLTGEAWDTLPIVAGGVDMEPENQSAPHTLTIEKCFFASDFDNLSQNGSTVTLTDVTSLRPMFPQIVWSTGINDVTRFTRVTCHCHKEGANKGGILSVSGTSDNPRGRTTGGRQIYDDCDWYMGADLPVWCQHGRRWEIQNGSECGLVIRLDAGATACQIEYKNCRFRRLVPAGRTLGNLYALWSLSSLNGVNGLVILSGHITFDSGFAQFPFRGSGGRIRIENGTTFAHAGFPGATTFWTNFGVVEDLRSGPFEYITTPEAHGWSDSAATYAQHLANTAVFNAAIAAASANAGSSASERGVVELVQGKAYTLVESSNGAANVPAGCLQLTASVPNVHIRTAGTPTAQANKAILRHFNWTSTRSSLGADVHNRSIIHLAKSNNVWITHIRVDGNKYSVGANQIAAESFLANDISYNFADNGGIHCIADRGSRNSRLEHVEAYNALVDSLSIDRFDFDNTKTSSFVALNCDFHHSRRQAFSLITGGVSGGGANQIQFTDCDFRNTGDDSSGGYLLRGEAPGSNFDCEPNNAGDTCYGLTFTRCDFMSAAGSTFELGAQRSSTAGRGVTYNAKANCADHRFIDCTYIGNRSAGWHCYLDDNITFTNLTITNGVWSGNNIAADPAPFWFDPFHGGNAFYINALIVNANVSTIRFDPAELTGHGVAIWKGDFNPTITRPNNEQTVTVNNGFPA